MSNYTPEQLKAITQKKGNLVVTASAGSGKTRVMTQRFIDLTVSGATEVDRVLCVTFTRLAAEELKSRLKRSLMNAMLASVGEKAQRLKRQLEKLPSAAVSTVHSFCNFLIQKYFYVAKVDPQFTVIDEKTSDGLKKSAVDELFESLYESGDKDFLILLETFISSRSDRALKEIVIRFYDFISSEVDGQAYLCRSVDAYGEQGVKNAVNGLIGIYIDKLCLLKDAAFKLIAASKDLGLDRYVAVLEPICEYIDKLDKTRSLSDLIAFSMGDFTKPRVTVKGDEEKKTVSDAVGDVLSHIKTIAEKCREYLNFADFNENARKAGKVLAALKSVVERFSSVYARLKSDIAALDYSDLEHYAYKVLCSDEVLNEVKSDYDYVFVDEYQDTNAIQEAIFSKIENDNLFVVGDEKQSIYGFRGCDSTIFAERIRAAQEDQLVSLDKNFRSAKSVVRAVNKVFTASMTPHCSGIDYAAHPMVYGGLYDGSDGVAALVVSGSGGAKKSDLVKGVYSVEKHLELLKRAEPQKEQVAVRKIVESVVGQRYFVTGADGKKEQKTIGFGDIAVLTRTSKAAVDKTVAELTAAGIPVSSDSKRSIGDYPEIKLIVDLLKAVYYGGKEDFSLAAALHSPVGGLDDESLMLIRKTFEGGTYYSAVRRYAEERIDGISIKLNDFFAYIGRLKTFAAFEPVVDIVKRLVKDSRLDAYFLTESFGALKEKRLERFIVEMESSDATLDDFVKNHEAILENMTVCLTGGDDSVKVMDIHQSKGLEFPVVILTEQGRNFFGMGRREKFTLSRKYGVGLKRYDAEKRTAYHTVVKNYVDEQRDADTLSEELRLYYVAMTRAMYSLYVIVDEPPAKRRLGYEADFAKCFKDFLCVEDFDTVIDLTEDEDAPAAGSGQRKVIFADAPDKATVEKIKKYVGFSYPYLEDVTMSVKKTVTAIAHSAAEIDEAENYPVMFPAESVEKGNAYHRFLEHSSLDAGKVEKELAEFSSNGILSDDEIALLDAEIIKKTLYSTVFDAIGGYKLYREKPFIVSVPAQLAGERGEDEVLVQGVIDLLAVNGDEAVIVDYKFSSRGAEGLKATYEKQLLLYAFAVEKVLKLKVTAKYILNIKTGDIVSV